MSRDNDSTNLHQVHVGHDRFNFLDNLGLGGRVNLLQLHGEDGLLLGLFL